MRSLRKSLTAAVLGASVAAHAGQTFSFVNPFAGGGSTYANAMFQSTGVYPGIPASTFENLYADANDLVSLTVTNYSDAGVFESRTTYTGVSYSLTDGFGNSTLNGTRGSDNGYVVEGGTLTFTQGSDVLLNIDFSGARQTGQSFGSDSATGQTLTFSGSKVTTTQTQNAKFSFGFPAPLFSNPSAPGDPVRTTSDYTSSIGAAPVPEPASIAALVVGGVGVLRRKRRA